MRHQASSLTISKEVSFPVAAFAVTLEDGDDTRTYTVTLSEDYYQHLVDESIEPEELIRAAFRFLLDRESKDEILTSFDPTDIKSYFPSFERDVHAYIAG